MLGLVKADSGTLVSRNFPSPFQNSSAIFDAHKPMRLVIHQPYFLPWLGYFAKIYFADAFVVLDDVQFRKRHFYDRVRIIDMHGEVTWLGLPVGDHLGLKCNDMILRMPETAKHLTATIRHSYTRARHFSVVGEEVMRLVSREVKADRSVASIDISLVTGLLGLLGITPPPIIYSSSLSLPSEPTARIIAICEQTGADELIIGSGSAAAVHDLSLVRDFGIRLYMQEYLSKHPVYSQVRRQHRPFECGLSIIDSLLNVGPVATREFLTDLKFSPQSCILSNE